METGAQWDYMILWEFQVRPGFEEKFEKAYGPGGDWVQLFKQDESYIGTELNRDLNNPRRYVTADFWRSRESYEQFREKHYSEYGLLDVLCETMTEKEGKLGEFSRIDEGRSHYEVA